MEQGEAHLELLALQVGEELADVGGHHQPLVADHLAGKRGDVEIGVALQAVFDFLAAQVEQGVEALGGDQRRRHDKGLDDLRQHPQGVFAQRVGVEGNRAEQHHPQVVFLAALLENRPLPRRVGKKQGRHGELFGQRDPLFGGDAAHEAHRHRAEQAAAVAGLAVGGDRPAVHHPRQGLDRVLEQLVAGPVFQIGEQAEAAVVPKLFGEMAHGR